MPNGPCLGISRQKKEALHIERYPALFCVLLQPCFLVLSLREPGVVPNCFLNVVMKDETE